MKKLVDARQRGLSQAVERHSAQEKELSAARQQLRSKTGIASANWNGDHANASRDGWLGAGRSLALGDRCLVMDDEVDTDRRGTIEFLGPTSLGEGEWVGINLDQPSGKHDGRVRGYVFHIASLKDFF